MQILQVPPVQNLLKQLATKEATIWQSQHSAVFAIFETSTCTTQSLRETLKQSTEDQGMSRILIRVQGVEDNCVLLCSADIAGVTISDRNQLSSLGWVEKKNGCSVVHFFFMQVKSSISNPTWHELVGLFSCGTDKPTRSNILQDANWHGIELEPSKVRNWWLHGGPTAFLLPKVMCGVDHVSYSIVAPLKEQHWHLTMFFEIIYVLSASNAKKWGPD